MIPVTDIYRINYDTATWTPHRVLFVTLSISCQSTMKLKASIVLSRSESEPPAVHPILILEVTTTRLGCETEPCQTSCFHKM